MIIHEEDQRRYTLDDVFELLKKVENDYERNNKCQIESLDDLFDIFYRAKIAEGIAERTLETYRENYRFFCGYLTSNDLEVSVINVTPTMIRNYITWMLKSKRKWDGHSHKPEKYQTEGLSPVTVNMRLKGLRTMFRFLHAEKLIGSNPFANIKNVKETEGDINILSVNQLKKLIRAPDRSTYSGYRDFSMLILQIDTFCRVGEIVSLKKKDIDFERGIIRLRSTMTKSRRSRVLPISEYTMKLLRKLIDYTSKKTKSEYVFLTVYGEKMRTNHFRSRLKKYAEAAGLDMRIYPYLLRHTGATMFLEANHNTRLLQLLLGHVDPRQVLRYTHLSSTYIKSEHEKHSPLNQVVKLENRENDK
ncbi:tyrosine-type recombinase/integrase [Brevibacillus fortis]|uniref:tyrosine-type recombinase/integrase n=1 Tax=Brevibacillus fortis TaxID=2126352 RepID=UPI0038FC129A